MAHIFQISISNGGVPKIAASVAQIQMGGVAGDWQNDRVHHGGPDRAVCIYSLELILALQAEGHPVFPGALGENLTLAGLSWSAVCPGMVIRLGEAATLEVVSHTAPCTHIQPYFQNNDSSRISQKKYPGWSRVYARVLKVGPIQIGDAVTIVEESTHDE